jgi:outer membrane protein assembly factor BamB
MNGYARWTVLVGPSHAAPALDEHGTTYVAGRDQQLYAVDALGRIAWVRQLEARPRGGVVVAHGAATVMLENGVVAWYTCDQGKLIKRLPIAIVPSAAPVLLANRWFIVSSTTGEIVKLDIRGIRWRIALPGRRSIGALAPDAQGAVIAAVTDGSLVKVSPDGTIAWQAQVDVSPQRSPVFGADGTLFVAAGHRLAALDASTGTPVWRAGVGGQIMGGPLVTDDGTVYVSIARSLVAISKNGEVATPIALPDVVVPGLTIADHRIWVGLSDSTLRPITVPQRGLARSPWAKARGNLSNSGESGGSSGLRKLEPE